MPPNTHSTLEISRHLQKNRNHLLQAPLEKVQRDSGAPPRLPTQGMGNEAATALPAWKQQTALLLRPRAALGGEEYSWLEGAAHSGGGPRPPPSRFSPPRRGLAGAHLGGEALRMQRLPGPATAGLTVQSLDGISLDRGPCQHTLVSPEAPLGHPGGGLHLGGGLAHPGTEGSPGTGPGLRRDKLGRSGRRLGTRCLRRRQERRDLRHLRQTSACPTVSGTAGSRPHGPQLFGAPRRGAGSTWGPLAAKRPETGCRREPRFLGAIGHGRPAPHPQRGAGPGRARFAH